MKTPWTTAILLIGFQNDYFHPEGILRGALEDATHAAAVLHRTISLLRAVQSSPTLFVATPIIFTPDYRELSEPVGILKLIKETGAFKQGTLGAMTHRDLATLGDRVLEIPGKRGLNAFAETHLNETLRTRGIKDVVLAGAVTSVCIDSTARSAHERGYRVTVLSDCTCGRTRVEEEFYCQQVFPLYAAVQTSGELVKELLPAGT